MSNTLNVAKKEFRNLMGSKLILIVLVWYVVASIGSFFYTYNNYVYVVSHEDPSDPYYYLHYTSPVDRFFKGIVNNFRWLGPILAVVLGFVSMTSEIDGKALGTMLTKPLYRDTIINGKLLGNMAFIIIITLLTTILYVAAILAMTGDLDIAFSLIERIPLVLLLSLLCMMFMFSLSVLIVLLIKDQSLALFMGFLSYLILFKFIHSSDVAGGIMDYFHSRFLGDLISGISPDKMFYLILGDADLTGILENSSFELFKMAMYCVVTLTLAYTVFLRRDIE